MVIVEESRLAKSTIFDYEEHLIGFAIKDVPYAFNVDFGKPLDGIKSFLCCSATIENDTLKERIPIKTSFSQKYDGLYNYAVPTKTYEYDKNGLPTGEYTKFESLLDVNPVLYEYGMQVQKVTRRVVGKKIHFVDLEEYKRKYKRYLPGAIELPR